MLVAGLLLQLSFITKPFPSNEYRDTTKNYIVMHYDNSPKPKTTFRWLRKRHNSYHYYITRTGIIYKLIDPAKIANHAGVSYFDGRFSMNKYSIGICLQNVGDQDYTEQQYASLTKLVKSLRQRYPDIRDKDIVGHSDVAIPRGRKLDPGPKFEWFRIKNPIDIDTLLSSAGFYNGYDAAR